MGDIIYQYINFCKVFDEMRKKYPESIVLAVKDTFRICFDKKLLSEFLKEHETELNDIMYDFLYNEEYWRKLMLRDERKKAREEGLAEGLAEGSRMKSLEVVQTGIQMNLSAEQISKLSGLSLSEVESMMPM